MFEQNSIFFKMSASLFLLVFIMLTNMQTISGHGRLIEPPSRASAWRYGFQTPPNYNDHELYCGGFARQWNKNGGKCGECGDAWDSATPRPHEYGGKWGQGVIVRKYKLGGNITIRVELTASHMGYFEFRLCPEVQAKQDCLDKNVLKIISGAPMLPMPSDLETRFYPRNGSRIYEIKAKLPDGVKCDQCVLQWRYIAGNNWGTCSNGTGMVGCGPQEEFRACADISIGEAGRTTIRPIRPGVKTTKSSTTKTTDTKEKPLQDDEQTSPFIAIIIIAVTLLVVICLLAAIYLYHYHGQRIKQLLHWKHQKIAANNPNENNKPENNDEQKNKESNKIYDNGENENVDESVPIPPPRTKRLSQSQSQDMSSKDLNVV